MLNQQPFQIRQAPKEDQWSELIWIVWRFAATAWATEGPTQTRRETVQPKSRPNFAACERSNVGSPAVQQRISANRNLQVHWFLRS